MNKFIKFFKVWILGVVIPAVILAGIAIYCLWEYMYYR
jgi:hypothetical protein